VPRLSPVSAARAADSSWEWRIAGTTPAITLRDRAAGRSSISLVASGSGSLVAEVADGTVESRIDSAGPTPDPPYGLSFASDRGDTGCAVVWLELPFPPRFP
jgi:hypothetical protein